MKKSWIISTVLLGIIVGAVDYFDGTTRSLEQRIFVWSIVVLLINTIFWLPSLTYLNKRNQLSFKSSVISSILSGLIGISVFLGLFIALFTSDTQDTHDAIISNNKVISSSITYNISGFIEPTLKAIIFWCVNGFIFWHLYLATTKK